MARIIVGILMILFISGKTTADEGIPMDVTELIQSIIGWGMKIYDKIQAHKNPDKSRENIVTIMKQVEEVQKKLDNLDTHLDIKLDSMLNTLLADIKLEGTLNILKGKLRHGFSKIDRYFDLSREYKYPGPFGNETLQNFAQKALWDPESVPDLLDNLHEAFIPGGISSSGFLNVMAERTQLNILHDCDTLVSAQQKVYYIYIQLIIAEIKGLMTQQACLTLKRWFDGSKHDYIAEVNITKTNFETRMIEYYELFTRESVHFSSQLRRCEVKRPKRGVDILEMKKFSRIAVLDSKVVSQSGCLACPGKDDLDTAGKNSMSTIYDCKAMGTSAKSCPGLPESGHEYLWWKDANSNHYGPNVECEKTKPIYGGFVNVPAGDGYPDMAMLCDVCVCSVDTNGNANHDDSSIWRISIHDQIADIRNNHVVTAIKFVTHDNALYLQIKEGRFSISGMVHNNSGWKNLHHDYLLGHVSPDSPGLYETLRKDRKTIYLDDIKVPNGYVITGVGFKLIDDSAFQLRVFASPYDLISGKVTLLGSFWVDASTYPYNPEDYKNKKRTEITMGSSDDPTRATEFAYSLESNKMIKFTHTDLYKDAGQTTIPLLDAQAVVAHPAFPLSGVGITFKGRDRYGGYLALHTHTLNAFHYVKFPKFKPDPPPPPTTTEYVEYAMYSFDEQNQSLGNSRYTVD